MTTRVLGAACAVLLLFAAIGILIKTRGGGGAAAAGAPAVVVMNVTAPSPGATTAPRGSAVALPRGESARAATARDDDGDDEPHELTIAPIAKAYVQREDGSMRANGAPPPVFRKATIDGMRAAVTPAVQRCIAAGLARSPEQRDLDSRPSVSVIYAARSTGGAVSVTDAQATINGTQDDAVVACVEAAYKDIAIRAPSEQPEGQGKVIATFDYK